MKQLNAPKNSSSHTIRTGDRLVEVYICVISKPLIDGDTDSGHYTDTAAALVGKRNKGRNVIVSLFPYGHAQ